MGMLNFFLRQPVGPWTTLANSNADLDMLRGNINSTTWELLDINRRIGNWANYNPRPMQSPLFYQAFNDIYSQSPYGYGATPQYGYGGPAGYSYGYPQGGGGGYGLQNLSFALGAVLGAIV